MFLDLEPAGNGGQDEFQDAARIVSDHREDKSPFSKPIFPMRDDRGADDHPSWTLQLAIAASRALIKAMK